MVKIFVGNLSASTTREDLQTLFTRYGKVTECDVLRNFGFVHMDKKEEAEEAVRKLHQYSLNGCAINVELSRGKPKGTTKLHVSNISSDCTNEDLRAKFEAFGPVVECDIVKDYAFIHMEQREDAMEAVATLDKSEFQGKRINVQLSTSRLRTVPGMGNISGCYVCGEPGHWSKDCRRGQNGSYTGGVRSSRAFPPPVVPSYASSTFSASFPPRSYSATIPVVPPASHTPTYGISRVYSSDARYLSKPTSTYPERTSSYERERYSSSDYYEKYRIRALSSRYLDDRHLSIPPPPPPPPPLSSSSLSRMRLAPSSLDLYDRRAVPLPSSATSAYYSRDRSPIRRVVTGSEGYAYERSRLSPVSRSSSYAVSRARDPPTERSRYNY